MSSGSLNDLVSVLSDALSHPDVAPAARDDLRRAISEYVLKSRKSDADGASRLQEELHSLFKEHVKDHPKKLGLFMTILRHLRPAIVAEADLVTWFDLAVKPFVLQPASYRASIDDAEHFVVEAMVYDEDAPDAQDKARTCATLTTVLLDAYMSRTSVPSVEDKDIPLRLKCQAAQQLQKLLVAFGRKRAKDLFLAIDRYLVATETRFQALGLLAAFVEQQQAHLYLVVHTDVVEHLLKCLMNDTATVVVAAALRCLIMLLPHIPATVATQLPRLFLIYSRCLCWEKFSAFSTKAQRDLVTDDRVRRGSESEHSDDGHVEDDPSWTTLHAVPDMPESSAPELLHYFTYLYGLYPLNFMSYVRKPRKYLKNLTFPGADEFDLDQAVIRSRTEQFQRVHLLHPSFFNTTVEDELEDNRWLKAEPSEVIAECYGLYVGQQSVLPKPGPPPTTKLPELPVLQTSPSQTGLEHSESGSASPTLGSPSRSQAAQRGVPAPEQDNLVGSPVDEAVPPLSTSVPQDVIQLQRELMSLRNEFVFERYLKQQHVAAISQLRRNHIKAVTIEAETATLINANRALQKKLGDAIKFNEKMQKETQARRTHTKQSEEQLTAKIRSLKADLTNQESIQRDLQQAKKDCEQLRQLLVESEARELSKQEELEALQAKAAEVERLQREVAELSQQIRMHRQHKLHTETTQAEQEMTKQELDSANLLLKHRDQELDRSKRLFQAKIVELEARLEFAESNTVTSTRQEIPEYTTELEVMLTDTRAKLAQTKKAYAQLLDDYTDLRIKFQELGTEQLTLNDRRPSIPMRSREQSLGIEYINHGASDVQSHGSHTGRLPYRPNRGVNEQSDTYAHQTVYPQVQGYPPARPTRPDIYPQRMMPTNSILHSDGAALGGGYSQDNLQAWTAAMSVPGSDRGRSPPEMLRQTSKSAFSINSEEDAGSTASKTIKAKSEVRVYGRGGAQNIKMKNKEKSEKDGKPAKITGVRGLKGIM